MDKTTEALKLALECLDGVGRGKYNGSAEDVITAIREALAEQPAQQEPVAVVSGYYGGQCVILPTNPAMLFNSGTAFYTSPQTSKPWEPCAFDEIADANANLGKWLSASLEDEICNEFRQAVEWWFSSGSDRIRELPRQSSKPLVPLTDEQLTKVIQKIDPNEHYMPPALKQLARAIEKAHGIGEQP